jgi:hypothetical protein
MDVQHQVPEPDVQSLQRCIDDVTAVVALSAARVEVSVGSSPGRIPQCE